MKPQFQHIQVGAQQSVLAFAYAKPSFEAPWHFHPQHELIYIQSSVGTKYVGDFVGSYEPGELVLLRSNLPHCWKNQVDPDQWAKSIVIQWEKGIYTRVPELDTLFDMLNSASRGILFPKEVSRTFVSRLVQLTTLTGKNLYLQLLTILMELSESSYDTLSHASFVDDLPIEYNDRISKIHDFVEENYDRKIFLSELADLVGMSEQSFSRFFSKMMGRPFFTFLNEYRINVASRMLTHTDWSVAQVGYACGYDSLPFFHKQFNKFKEVPPSKFRKKYAPMR